MFHARLPLSFILIAGDSANGFQTVRIRPSVFGEKLASLEQGTPVRILENTDQFLDGHLWFRIRYDGVKEGYKWDSHLCWDNGKTELNTVVRWGE